MLRSSSLKKPQDLQEISLIFLGRVTVHTLTLMSTQMNSKNNLERVNQTVEESLERHLTVKDCVMFAQTTEMLKLTT